MELERSDKGGYSSNIQNRINEVNEENIVIHENFQNLFKKIKKDNYDLYVDLQNCNQTQIEKENDDYRWKQ